ncbi:hypothetical protein VE01_03823 [Pseudogymnoascus verrucosus]|uniref:F-box domain-containing protein n=1 Tax=Pseudogymnoascus verrucosus TaxID=342668 RepID=A0A1B8GQW6_9PEZI|nr:uncharacterized protein VE01_03823 [Pseudogymnoascus verrucosus]OBT98231.1 hypothetical protein VE01_03823 [Pseudogymnoascus verrucosus]
MYFQKLPNEVIQQIFSELPTSDLKALSLVCKELDARVTPLFFSCLAFWLGPEDLDRLATISESARLSRHVTTLLIQDGMLQTGAPKPRGFLSTFSAQHQPGFRYAQGIIRGVDRSTITSEAFQSATVADFPETAISDGLKQLGWTPETLFGAYKEHGRIIEEYNKFINEKTDIDILSALLQRLTSLTEVQLCNWSEYARKTSVNAIVKIQILEPDPFKNGRALDRFLQAAARTTIPSLSTLVLKENEFFYQVDDFTTLDPSIIKASLPALRNLSSLTLPMRTRTWNRPGFTDIHRENLAALLLSGLPHLRHLRIYTKESMETSPLELSPILDAISSDQLESIDLEWCTITLDSVESFLRRHSKTLKTMRFNYMILIQAHFETLFTLVRDITKLEEMVITRALVEKSHRRITYGAGGCQENQALEIKSRHEEARKEVARFATRKTDRFPRELLDVDSSLVDDIYNSKTSTCLGVIGENFLPETWDKEGMPLRKMELF